jgi:acyl-CoA hydrolase
MAGDQGEISRVVAELPPGSNVGVPRYLMDFVVTEWGVTSLYGKSERARAAELIALAYPHHCAVLGQHARFLGLL